MAISSSAGGRYSHSIKEENRKPFLPPYTLQDMLCSPQTPIGNPLLDAITEAIVSQQFTTAKEVAEYLDIHPDYLSQTVKIFTGCTLGEVVSYFVVDRVKQYLDSHPDDTLDQVALATGYKTKSAIRVLFKKHNLGTPRNNTSHK